MADSKTSELSAATSWATDDLLYFVDVTAGTSGGKKITVEDLFTEIVSGVVIKTDDGVDITPGSDTDTDLITLNVTGTPRIWWDESLDAFVATKPLATPYVRISEQASDPADPAEGESVLWQSNGTGLGDDGQMMSITQAGSVISTYSIDRTLIPSGDTTQNTEALNAALTASASGDTVYITGPYYVNDTVVVPSGVTLSGKNGMTNLGYVGTTDATKYAITTTGGMLKDLLVGTDYRRRGIQIATTYQHALQNVYVDQPVTFGIVASNSWGSTFTAVRVTGDGLGTGTCVPIYGTNLNSTLWNGVCISANDCSGANQHAFQVVTSNDVKVHNLVIESNDCGANAPVIITDCNVVELSNVRFESNETSTVNISVTASGATYSRPIRIVNVSNSVNGQTTPPYVIGLYSYSQAVIEGVWANSSHIASGVVYMGSGTHITPQLRNIYSDLPYITLGGGATVTDEQNIFQPAPAQIEDGDTAITAANLQSKILYMVSSSSGRAPTVPTGTAVNGIVPVGNSIQWTFINTGSQVITITTAAGQTLVGDMTLAAGESGTFITRVASANTAVTYRI